MSLNKHNDGSHQSGRKPNESMETQGKNRKETDPNNPTAHPRKEQPGRQQPQVQRTTNK